MPAKKKDIEKSQPEINIGLVGHVDHGKTTLTECLSGKWTDTHSEEIRRGITIRLGYADTIFRKCTKCKAPECYTVAEKCEKCGAKSEPIRKVSFVDAPGHESLMATMLSGATIMDGALLIVAANEECPQPQTMEHLMALDIIGVKSIIVVQNKIDLANKDDLMRNFKQIKKFLASTPYENAPIIPISAQHKINVDVLIEKIQEIIKTPKRDPKKEALMFVARSFDINKPGSEIDQLTGGVLGGTLVQGCLKVGDEIELKPGHGVDEKNQKVYYPIRTKITSLITGGEHVKEVIPGGSIGVMTTLDPAIVKSDNLSGNVVGLHGKLPEIWMELKLKTKLLERVVGSEDELKVDPIKLGEKVMLNVNAAATVGTVTELGKNSFQTKLKLPVCADKGASVTISRLIGTRFRLIGYGTIS